MKSTKSKLNIPENMIALVHLEGGTGLLHSLIDGHPEISTLPSVYFSEYFNHTTWEKITNEGWDLIVDNFMNIYDVLFDARSTIPVSVQKKDEIFHWYIKRV